MLIRNVYKIEFTDDVLKNLEEGKQTDVLVMDFICEKNWKMAFHPPKSQVLTISRKRKQIHHNYSLNNHLLLHVSSAKYLGCITNNTLDWGQHITSITTKANNTLGLLRRN